MPLPIQQPPNTSSTAQDNLNTHMMSADAPQDQQMLVNGHAEEAKAQTTEDQSPEKPSVRRLVANAGQPVGPSGVSLPQQICKGIIEAVKSGDREKLQQELMVHQVELRDVVDAGQFNQNLCFTACQVNDEAKAM